VLRGCHKPEGADRPVWRWTNEDLLVQVGQGTMTRMLDIDVASLAFCRETGRYVKEGDND